MVLITPSSPLNALKPGLQFHQYRLLEQIGMGGQGVVWSAVDQARGDVMAVKFTDVPETTRDQSEALQFEKEIQALLKLDHAHVLPLTDYGRENQIQYTVSPYVSGGSLYEKIKLGQVNIERALRYASETASALDYLHAQGIIHRDLKASNILMDVRHHSYLTDFGLARAVSLTTQAMHTGRGTPPYAPPEQHKLAGITPRSDVFSFGILLYELFTGQLPWDGERILGIQQLYAPTELPNPLELNPKLPPLVPDVLRRVTSANPAQRPGSAGEAMRMIYYIFNLKGPPIPSNEPRDQAVIRQQEADELLRLSLERWQKNSSGSRLNLTKFALLDLWQKKKNEAASSSQFQRFMLFHALTFGYEYDYWWSQVPSPAERLQVCTDLLETRDEESAGRVLEHLVQDPQIRVLQAGLPSEMVTSLLQMAAGTNDSHLREQLIGGLRRLVPVSANWNDQALAPEQNALLGELALEDSDFGDEAARLIGRLRSQPAIKVALARADESRRIPLLLEIRHSAGGLPPFVQGGLRRQVWLEWLVQRLTTRPANLVAAYALALLGATLGIALQVYLTYRLPEFMDTVRITSSLEQGLIIGAIFGLGIFTARLLVERFTGSNLWPRLLFGTVIGAAGMSIAMFVFHIIFLNTPPSGYMIPAGCLLIASSYALGGLLRSRLLKMALATLATFGAIAGSWVLHSSLANSSTTLTPLFRYDYTWPLSQVLLTSLGVALVMGILAPIVRLDLPEE